jgi:hypothetical protein
MDLGLEPLMYEAILIVLSCGQHSRTVFIYPNSTNSDG